ncbi:RNA-guided endonuclease InsQ/TnpB family protein [Haloactinospora alba]|nr:RNA-guided endonuclease TnpB family protein [Haloactinospora alba]
MSPLRPVGPSALDKMLTQARATMPWLRDGSSVPQQQIIRDFGRSKAKAVKDRAERVPQPRRAGMPKFKKKQQAGPSLNYTQRGFSLRGRRLRLAGGIEVRPVWSRDLPATPSSVRVYRDTLGHWYASFVVHADTKPLPDTGQALGVGWGVTETATTTSDAHDLPHAQHGKAAQAKLTRYQRMMARRRRPKGKPQTRGYRKAQQAAAKQHRKAARKRQDDGRKWAKHVVRDHDRVAVEDFKPTFLAKTTMARKAADAAIGATKHELVALGRKHGRDVRLVDPAHTTMDCGQCGARTTHRLPLSERTYTCTACGVSRPRDKNSARVMLDRAGFVPAGDDGVSPGRPMDGQAA